MADAADEQILGALEGFKLHAAASGCPMHGGTRMRRALCCLRFG